MKLRFPIDDHEDESGGKGFIYWAVRTNGMPATEFPDKREIEEKEVVPMEWPWNK